MPTKERVERLFKCSRCKIRFQVNVEPELLDRVKCPRSCPAEVTDVTEETEASWKKHEEERLRRVEEREKKYEEDARKAQEEATSLSKKRGER